MIEQLLHEEATIGENKSSELIETDLNRVPSEKRRRKRHKSQNAQKNKAELNELGEETSVNSNCEEISTELVNATDVSTKTCSKIEQSNMSTLAPGKKKKGKKKKKGNDSLNGNSTGPDNMKATSSNGAPLEGDIVYQLSACTEVDGISSKHGAEPILFEDTSVGQQETQRRDTKESSNDARDNCDGLHLSGGLPARGEKVSLNNSCLEQSTELVNAADVSSKTYSQIKHPGGVLTPSPGKKKRVRKKKDKDSMNGNGAEVTGPDNLAANSSNDAPLQGDVVPQPLACIKADDKMSKHGAELSLSEHTSMGQQENWRHEQKGSCDDALVNKENCQDLQVGSTLPVLDVKAINSAHKLDGSSLPKVPDQLSFPPNSVNVSPVSKLFKQADANNVLDEDQNEEENVTTYARKRRKVTCSLEKSSETSADAASSLVLILPDVSRNNCLNCPDEVVASGCSGDTLEQGALAGNDTSMAVGKDSLFGNNLGGCSDFKHPSMDISENSIKTNNAECFVKDVMMADLAGENYELAEGAKLYANVNAESDMHSAEEKMYSEEKASVDGSAHGPCQKLDQKIQTKMEESIASSSELGSLQVNATQPINQPSPGRALNGSSKKKLLILDVNGLLADIVPYDNVQYEPDTVISTKAVFKRPFCDDFLKFCFERFNVGVWSSRTKKNVQRVIGFLFQNKGYSLHFCWDQSHCTETGFKTIENREKPLLLKELKKLWEKQDPDLPWERGEYDESNTLLLDDSPYKALRNPPYTAIFPYTFEYWHKTDNALAAKGHLRLYLERLAAAENVQKFVELHPFGQRPITKTNLSWPFYLKVISSTSSQLEAGGNSSSVNKPQLGEDKDASLAC